MCTVTATLLNRQQTITLLIYIETVYISSIPFKDRKYVI